MPKSNLGRHNSSAKISSIYLDYSSSVLPNPSSIHTLGVEAKNKLENARKEVAMVLQSRPEEIIFTSGGTESNNLAIQGLVFSFLSKKEFKKIPHIITTNIEHSSVLETFRLLESRKIAEISIVDVDEHGMINPKKLKKEFKENTILVSVMYANNEIGTIEPIKEIAKEIRHYNKTNRRNSSFPIYFHTDAVQAVNYLNLDVLNLGVDMLSLSGTKIDVNTKKTVHSGMRVGVLYKRKAVPLVPIFGGGDQESGLRPGTENLPEILNFASALQSIQKTKDKEHVRLAKLRDYFLSNLQNMSRTVLDTEIIINGDLKNRLPNNVNITIPKIPSDLLVVELSAKGVMASAKSACKSGDGKASYVIQAIRKIQGKTLYETDGALRFSLGRDTKKSDIDYTVKNLSKILQKLKKWYD
jgi:cysteine desulfurase